MGELQSAVDALAAMDPDLLDPAQLGDLLVEVALQRDRLAAVCARLTAVHDRRAAWKAEGARSQKEWLTGRCRLDPGVAGRQSRDARHLAELPRTAEAFAAGTITAAQAATATAAARDLPTDALAGLDALVVREGPALDPARLRSAVDSYVHQADADALADREARAHRNRRLTINRAQSGAVAGEFLLDPVAGETLLTAVAAHAAPQGADDTRTAEQRRADALTTIAALHLDRGNAPMVGGVRPHVTIVVHAATLQRREGARPAQLDRLGAVSATAARQLTCDPTLTRVTTAGAVKAGDGTADGGAPRYASGGCPPTIAAAGAAPTSAPGRGSPDPRHRTRPPRDDAAFSRVVTAGVSQPLDVGRASRVVTVAQRRALAVRDQGCIGCGAPTGWCEAHHVKHWVDGGATDLDNLVLVCWRCHRAIHHDGRRPVRGPDGRWSLQRRSHSPP